MILGRNNETIKKYTPKIKYKSLKILEELSIILNFLNVKNTIITNKLNIIVVNKLICKESNPRMFPLDTMQTNAINKKHK